MTTSPITTPTFADPTAPTTTSSGPVVPANGLVKADKPRMSASAANTAKNAFADVSASMFRLGLAQVDQPNFVMSPYSIVSALGMTSAGAKGAAAEAFTKLLGGNAQQVAGRLTAVDASIATAVEAGANPSNEAGDLNPTTIESANQLFLEKTFQVQPAFLDSLASGYGAGVQLEDFRGNPGAARGEINSWVSDRTHGLIPELLPSAAVRTDTRLALVNALYLKAAWQVLFSKVAPQPFTPPEGQLTSVETIEAEDTVPYAKGSGWQSVTLPYGGRQVAMTIILPDSGGIKAFLESFNGRALNAALAGVDTKVKVQMPKFNVTASLDMVGVLKTMGATAIFGDADFSGIGGQPGDIEINAVIHQAKISVDEHGTEAAAATAVMMGTGAPAPGPESQPIEFFVDRPFLYVIADTKTQMPLFIGSVQDPSI